MKLNTNININMTYSCEAKRNVMGKWFTLKSFKLDVMSSLIYQVLALILHFLSVVNVLLLQQMKNAKNIFLSSHLSFKI